MKVFLVPNVEIAREEKYTATVEAVYGEVVIEGSEVTLEHHAEGWKHNPAPCNTKVSVLPEDSTILLSHFDADSLGGVLSLMGKKPEIEGLWEAVEYIDIHGEHRLHELSQREQELYNSLRAMLPFIRSFNEKEDITQQILELIPRINKVDSLEAIQKGRERQEKIEAIAQEALQFENRNIRAFISDSFGLNAQYYSPNIKAVAHATIFYSTKNQSITIAFEDGGKRFQANAIVKELWGPEAGGHAGIAGTPRTHNWSEAKLMKEFRKGIEYLNKLY